MTQKKSSNIFHNIMDETEKIVSIDTLLKFLIPFFVICIIVILASVIIQNKKAKKDFYQSEMHFKLGECIDTPNYKFYKVNGIWFGVQGQINANICPNDSITKMNNSFDLTVYKPNGNKKNYTYYKITFESIEKNKELKRYFRINADTLKATFDCYDKRIE